MAIDVVEIWRKDRKAPLKMAREISLSPSEKSAEINFDSSKISMNQVLSIELIFIEVLKKLPVNDLLKCSLVSKTWNHFARLVLRNHKTCLAKIKERRPCQDVRDLMGIMESSVNPPFNGLSITIGYMEHKCVKHKNWPELVRNLIEKCNVQCLHIEWKWDFDCPAVLIFKQLLTKVPCTLRGLALLHFPPRIESIYDAFQISLPDRNRWLVGLRTLEIHARVGNRIVDEVLVSSPNLEKIFGTFSRGQRELMLRRRKARIVKELDFEPWDSCGQSLSDFSREEPVLRKLKISMKYFPLYEPLETVFENVKCFFDRCCSNLSELEIDHLTLICLYFLDMRPLVHLIRMTLWHDTSLDDRVGFTALKRIQMTKLFPNLHSVEMRRSCDRASDPPDYCSRRTGEILRYIPSKFDEGGNDAQEFTCNTVKEIRISGYPRLQFSSISVVFPFVTQSELVVFLEPLDSFSSLWSAWQSMEEVIFTERLEVTTSKTWDAAFCGITEEEAARLQRMETAQLMKLNIVPIRPSILNLTYLKRMRIEVPHKYSCSKEKTAGFFSKVTACLALSRMPNLTVQVQRKECRKNWLNPCRYKLDHLKPYVKFV